MPAHDTRELSLRATVSLLAVPTRRTGAARVTRVKIVGVEQPQRLAVRLDGRRQLAAHVQREGQAHDHETARD